MTTHGDETEDVKILKTPEAPTENAPLPVASTKLAEKPAAEIIFTEMPASEAPPPIEVEAAGHTTIGNVLTETIQGEAAGSEATITTLISVGND